MADRSDYRMREIKKRQRAKRMPCHICGEAIDYGAPRGDPRSFSYDHIKPWSTHPELRFDPSNGASAHLKCNQRRGNRDLRPGLGFVSEEW